MRRSTLVIAAFAAMLAALPVHAQANHRGVIVAQLDHVTQVKTAEGFAAEKSMNPERVVGLLPNQSTVLLEVNLRAGVEYFIAAGCDTDCDDLDLRLNAPGISEAVAEDVEDDDVPLFTYTAKQSGPHMLTVRMAKCSTDLCYFGFTVMAKQ